MGAQQDVTPEQVEALKERAVAVTQYIKDHEDDKQFVELTTFEQKLDKQMKTLEDKMDRLLKFGELTNYKKGGQKL